MTKFNIGLIGGGFMCKSHTNAYLTARYIFPDENVRAELKAICARNPEKTKYTAERYGYARDYTDLDQMLQDEEIDLYDICAPAENHKEMALKIIGAGKNLLCEKPLALFASDAQEMYAAAKEKGVQNYVGFNYRFLPAVLMAKRMLEDGTLGTPRHMRVCYFQQNGADAERPLDEIRYARTENCGNLQEIGSHAIDQMRFLIGELDTISSIVTTYVPERKTKAGEVKQIAVEDASASIVTFQNGTTGTLESSAAFWGKKNHLSWEIFCSEGSMIWNLENPNYLGVYKKGSPEYADGITMVNVTGGNYPYGQYWWPGSHNLGWEHAQINMIQGMMENIAAGEQIHPVATFRDGYRTAVIIEAIRESSRTGERIHLQTRWAD